MPTDSDKSFDNVLVAATESETLMASDSNVGIDLPVDITSDMDTLSDRDCENIPVVDIASDTDIPSDTDLLNIPLLDVLQGWLIVYETA